MVDATVGGSLMRKTPESFMAYWITWLLMPLVETLTDQQGSHREFIV